MKTLLPSSHGFAPRLAHGEWKAWVDSAFLITIFVLMAFGIRAFLGAQPVFDAPEAHQLGRVIAGIFIAWVIVSHLLRKRWANTVVADERDTQIALKTTQLSLYMLVCGLIAFAVGLSANPIDRLQWLSYALIAHLIIMIIVLAHLIGNLAQIAYYLRDRRSTAP